MSYIGYNIVKYAKSISWVMIQEEIFVFHEPTNKISVLKGIDKDIWIEIDRERSIDRIANELRKKHADIDDKLMERLSMYHEKGILMWEK